MRISDWSSDVCSSDLTDCLQYTSFKRETFSSISSLRCIFIAGGITSVVCMPCPASTSSDIGIQSMRGVVIGSVAASYRRSEEHTSELQSLMRISYAVFCLKTKITHC